MAILHFVKHYQYYHQHRPLLICTDHQPLVHIRTMEPRDTVCRPWLDILASYNFKVLYGLRRGQVDRIR